MCVLILHRNPLRPFPYGDWLAGYDGDVVVLAARDRLAPGDEQLAVSDPVFTRFELFDDFDEPAVDARALELAEKFTATHVVALHEADVLRAAALRECLGLAGAWTADVEPYRDKVLMKARARAAGIEVAEHTPARTAEKARRFAAAHGFPLVLKERSGYNSIGLRICRDRPDFDDAVALTYPDGVRDDVLLEKFVPGRMCHVDGYVADGEVAAAWPSQYQYELASFGSDPGPRVDLTLDVDDPLTPRLLTLAKQVLAALSGPGSRLRDHAFHMEVFHTPDDRLVLCEAACRSGGAKIREVFLTLFGVHLGAYVTQAEAGLPAQGTAPAPDGSLPRPRHMSGQVLTMKRPGLVRRLPAVPDDAWVRGFWLFAEEGQVIAPAAGSADFLTAAVGSAPTREECERRLRELGARVMADTEIEPLYDAGDSDSDSDHGPEARA
ncbi:acetyl-CoA carboxylase biotin carboxylase subunit family protein [Streptomyces sp. NPDC057694]|uniref:ATP-grasp domain-containing protein n=1 Tax=Streptomyces sp. NPDC057694 TaxID=3346216 RepID=UPI003690505D